MLVERGEQAFTYEPVGGTRDSTLPKGFPHNRHAALLGHGEEVFARARHAIRSWRMYDLEWTELCWPAEPAPGFVFGVLARHHGLWSFNPCRVVYTADEVDPLPRYGFAIGTLPGHSESGEERFSVERRSDDSVWYEIHTFARAQAPLARLAPPLVRYYQRRFGRESLVAVSSAVNEN